MLRCVERLFFTMVLVLLAGIADADDIMSHDEVVACAKGKNPRCELALGLRYMQGKETKQDWRLAAEYIDRAVNQGYTPAYIGKCSFYVQHPNRDNHLDNAIAACEDAAYLGNTYAHIVLGALFEMESPRKDLVQSYIWYYVASLFVGNQQNDAKARLANVERQLMPSEKLHAQTGAAAVLVSIDQNLRQSNSEASTPIPSELPGAINSVAH